MTEQAQPSEAERLGDLADRCEVAMIQSIERALAAEVGPVRTNARTNARTAAAEYAVVAGMIRDRAGRLNVDEAIGAPPRIVEPAKPEAEEEEA